ncbi:hypothetical protein KO495_10285 [Colwellia sp. D2M02]|uniref:hypothetical protein n=1 Tax=Colwellia sp. D2M02 TaxID=2841562 RepID=UPI001C08413C|nr:hypothetical protein [Colwellia sp. D2M02]MBU2893708.1 hypothetical protein [Colwellia sp. D2M02]
MMPSTLMTTNKSVNNTFNKAAKKRVTIMLAVLLSTGLPTVCAAETLKGSVASAATGLSLYEGVSIDFQRAGIKGVFDSSGVVSGIGINYQTKLMQLTRDTEQVNLYGRINYQLNQGEQNKSLTQSEITMGVNWAYSGRVHYYVESSLMKQQVDSAEDNYSELFELARIGTRYNFYQDNAINIALEYRDGVDKELGYRIALEAINGQYVSSSIGYQSVGDNQVLFLSLQSAF